MRRDWTALLDVETLDLVHWQSHQLRESLGDERTPTVLYAPLTDGRWLSARTTPGTNGLSVSISPAARRVAACEEDLQRAKVAERVGMVQRARSMVKER